MRRALAVLAILVMLAVLYAMSQNKSGQQIVTEGGATLEALQTQSAQGFLTETPTDMPTAAPTRCEDCPPTQEPPTVEPPATKAPPTPEPPTRIPTEAWEIYPTAVTQYGVVGFPVGQPVVILELNKEETIRQYAGMTKDEQGKTIANYDSYYPVCPTLLQDYVPYSSTIYPPNCPTVTPSPTPSATPTATVNAQTAVATAVKATLVAMTATKRARG